MSRLKRFASAVVTGYIALAANVLFSLGSIPLALRYLSDEQFGLWSIITLIGTYLALVDLGMSSAFARLLIDHKDDPDQRSYTSLIKSAWLVLVTQAFLVVIVAFIGSWVLPALLKVTPSLQGDFRWLLLAQGGLLAFSFTTKVFPQLLSAHHRLDLVNIGVALGFGVSFFVLWLAFRAGCGVSSLVWAGAASAAFILIFYAFSCLILRIFPKPGTWGPLRRTDFWRLFNFGKDIFLITLSHQLLLSAPAFIITRYIGLAEAALWTVSTRSFYVIGQLCWRPYDMTYTLFSEMISRGEIARLRSRFLAIVKLTMAMTAVGALGIAFCNKIFVRLLTSNRMAWDASNDWLLGAWLLVFTVVRCHSYLLVANRTTTNLRNTYLIEVMIFFAGAVFVVSHFGLSGILVCSIVCSLLFTGQFSVRANARILSIPMKEVGYASFRPVLLLIVLLAPLAATVSWLTRACPPLHQIMTLGLIIVTVATGLLPRLAMATELRMEFARRFPARLRPLLSWVIGARSPSPSVIQKN